MSLSSFSVITNALPLRRTTLQLVRPGAMSGFGYLPPRLKIQASKPTTTITSRIVHIPPYPPIQPLPIQPPPQVPPFIMFPLCANVAPVPNRAIAPMTKASNVFMSFPIRKN